MNIDIINYSEKSILIKGVDTKMIKNELKKFCVWNNKLNDWISKPINKHLVEGLIHSNINVSLNVNEILNKKKTNTYTDCFEFLTSDMNVKRFNETVSQSLGIKSLIVDDPNLFPNSKRSWGFVGFGCGFAHMEYDKRNKKTLELIKIFNNTENKFIEWFINNKITKQIQNELNDFGCPIRALIHQDINIQSILKQLGKEYIELNGGKIKYIRTMLD